MISSSVARHEARAAGILLRAGFEIEWEDEADRRSGRHGEFIATFPATGRKFWVEYEITTHSAGQDPTLHAFGR